MSDSDSITGNLGEYGNDNAVGKGITQQNVHVSPGVGQFVPYSDLSKTVADLDAVVFGNRLNNFPGIMKVLDDVAKRLESLENEVSALRDEIHGRRLMVSDNAARWLLWIIAIVVIISSLPWDLIRGWLS